MGKQWKQWQTLYFGAPKSLHMVNCSHEIKRSLLFGRKAISNLDSILKSRDITLPTKVHLVKAIVFVVIIYGCESWIIKNINSWALKNWYFWTVLLEKILESPFNSKEINSVNPRGNQSWIFIGRTDAEAETPILWPPNVKYWLTGRPWCWKRLKAGREGDDTEWDGWVASST